LGFAFTVDAKSPDGRSSSADPAIFGSSGWLIFGGAAISRPADDRAVRAAYREGVHIRLPVARRWRPSPLVVDGVLAALLTAGAQLEIWDGTDGAGHRLPAALAALAIMAPIAVRHRYPAVVGTGVPLASAAAHALWNPSFIGYPIATFCALYALTAWTLPRRFALGTVLVAAAFLATLAAHGASVQVVVPFTVVTVAVMLLVRRIVGDRERRARMAERERDVAAREAVVAERARVARELHDVIAHNVSMMVLQAGAERRVLDGTSSSTREVLQTIEQVGRSALTEMRRLLGMLRSDAVEPLRPQPGLAQLPTLIAQVREAGLPVELRIDGEPRSLPAGIELSAFRIVQEALTNTMKHAGQARAQVSVRYRADVLELEILDDGPGATRHAAGGATSRGHGLVGMRERVTLYGGHLDTGDHPAGGFAVRVRLPAR
jgi:signal transduction histidine kinase